MKTATRFVHLRCNQLFYSGLLQQVSKIQVHSSISTNYFETTHINDKHNTYLLMYHCQ